MFDFDDLCKLAYLGLWESAEFYAAEQYDDGFRILTTRSNGYILFRYRSTYDGVDGLVRLDLDSITLQELE